MALRYRYQTRQIGLTVRVLKVGAQVEAQACVRNSPGQRRGCGDAIRSSSITAAVSRAVESLGKNMRTHRAAKSIRLKRRSKR